MKMWQKNLLLLLVAALLIASPLVLLPDADFEGADDQAEEAIGEINPSYEPWFEPFFEPASEEAEKLLFAVQAILGGSFLGYYIWLKKRKRELKPE